MKSQKKNLIDLNEAKIVNTKRLIDKLEADINKSQNELKQILFDDKAYFTITLKNGVDCRESGLGWIIKKLAITEENLNSF